MRRKHRRLSRDRPKQQGRQAVFGDSNIVTAFSEEHVERLAGLSKAQLRYWDRTGFFRPSYADEDRRAPYSRVYSFRDLVALRTLGVLRNQHQVPLQHLRQVAKKLSHLKDALWTKTVLHVLNKRVVFIVEGKPQDALTGQLVLPVPLKVIISDMSEASKKLRQRQADQFGKVVQNRYVVHNAAVVAGTRIPTRAIRAFKDAGYTTQQIIHEYPDLTEADVRAALAHEERGRTAA